VQDAVEGGDIEAGVLTASRGRKRLDVRFASRTGAPVGIDWYWASRVERSAS
jgi:hypothetical protein